MGRYRTIIDGTYSEYELQLRPPATPEQLSRIETSLGIPLPQSLRDLYEEFDGAWFGSSLPSEDEFLIQQRDLEEEPRNFWMIWPCALMVQTMEDLRKTWYSEIEGWLEEFSKCAMIASVEGGARFFFLTDLGAWGVRPGFIGKWDHDGNPDEVCDSLERYLNVR